MNQIVKLTEQRIEGNIKEITLLKIKMDSLISELSDTCIQIKSIQQDNDVIERELIDYVNTKSVRDTSNGERFTHSPIIQDNGPNLQRSVVD